MESVSTDFLEILMQECKINFFLFFLKVLIDHLLLLKNISLKNYSMETLKILLQHPRPKYTIAISQKQVSSSTDLDIYTAPKIQYPETKTKNKVPVIKNFF